MKKLTLIPLLLVTTSLTGCSFVMKWYKNATNTSVTKGINFTVEGHDDLEVAANGASPFTNKDDKTVSAGSFSLAPASYNHHEDRVYIDRDHDGKPDVESYDPDFVNQYREDSKEFYILEFSVHITNKSNEMKQVYISTHDGYSNWNFSSDMGKALRIAFFNNDYSANVKPLIWAPEQTRENCHYCYVDEDHVREASYGDEDKFLASDDIHSAPYAWDDASNYPNYLGTLNNEGDTLPLTVMVWLEGSDPNATNLTAEKANLNVDMKLYFNIY